MSTARKNNFFIKFQVLLKKRVICLIFALIFIFALSVRVTNAYLTDSVNNMNVIKMDKVSCKVSESYADGEFVNAKKNVSVENTGSEDIFVRLRIIALWRDDQGNIFTERFPELGADYTITYGDMDRWKYGNDDYYYYTEMVHAHSKSQNLIEECMETKTSTKPNGYYLSVEFLTLAIQAYPSNVVIDDWGFANNGAVLGLNSEGKLIVK